MKTAPKVWGIKETKLKLGNDLCGNLLFVHAILGCDTTPNVFSLGKALALKKFLKRREISRMCCCFQFR